MRLDGDSASAAAKTAGRPAVRLRRGRAVMAGMLIGIAALALAGCGSSDGPGAFMVDPGRYTNYHCNDLATRAKELAARQLELQGLIDKASESGGGAVIGSLAYRSDYDAAVADGKLVQRDAAAKNCGFMPNSLSDHTIR